MLVHELSPASRSIIQSLSDASSAVLWSVVLAEQDGRSGWRYIIWISGMWDRGCFVTMVGCGSCFTFLLVVCQMAYHQSTGNLWTRRAKRSDVYIYIHQLHIGYIPFGFPFLFFSMYQKHSENANHKNTKIETAIATATTMATSWFSHILSRGVYLMFRYGAMG